MMHRIQIQPRDLEIFQFIYDNKIASVFQIQKKFFPNSSYRMAHRRLFLLKKCGFLSSIRHFETAHIIYFGSKNMVKLLIGKGMIVENATPTLANLYTLNHDLRIIDTILALQNDPVFRCIKSETQLKRCLMPHLDLKIPDIMFTIDNGELFNFAVEIELNPKTKDRYRSIFSNYYFKSDINAALYLTSNESMIEKLILNEKAISHSKSKKIYFATLDAFLENPLECLFRNSDGDKFRIKYMFTNKNRGLSEGVNLKQADNQLNFKPIS